MSWHFVKRRPPLGTPWVSVERQINLSDFHTTFNFIDRIHSGNQAHVRSLLQDPKWRVLFADIAAATLARLVRAGTMGRPEYVTETLLEEALKCCRAALFSRGYETRSVHELRSDLEGSTSNFLVLAGCQEDRVRDARVAGAFATLDTLHHVPFTVVLSGLRPPPPAPTRCPDEVAAMRETLDRLLELAKAQSRRQLQPQIVQIAADRASQTTEQNVANVFDEVVCKSTQDCSVLLATSTFHLLRLARAAESYIDKLDLSKVAQLILVGTEEALPLSGVARQYNYVKGCAFEVFHYLIADYLDHDATDSQTPLGPIPPLVSRS